MSSNSVQEKYGGLRFAHIKFTISGLLSPNKHRISNRGKRVSWSNVLYPRVYLKTAENCHCRHKRFFCRKVRILFCLRPDRYIIVFRLGELTRTLRLRRPVASHGNSGHEHICNLFPESGGRSPAILTDENSISVYKKLI
ncbi:hypothetical protein NDN08_002543 [Rhodosorus marinus]|uniref:Uncharacterized protein n=1 Tax=Rhodosorus marinus TaxID=101924 RepID=A0AAV8UWQ3_9RHOD|nr:hypothetical protein NDN08_002543 [Rhodosorus marinus]